MADEEKKDAEAKKETKEDGKKEGAPKTDGKAESKGVKKEEEGKEAPKQKAKKEKKSQKERPKSKKKHTSVQIWKRYDVKDGKAERKNKSCPRCGQGTFLAEYKERSYCGKCGYGQMKNKNNDSKK